MIEARLLRKLAKWCLRASGLEWKMKSILHRNGFYDFPVRPPQIIALDNYKTIYIPIPKVANSSIKSVCADLLGLEIPEGFNKVTVFDGRPFPFLDKDEVDSEYKDYFKFAFVRNPWDRLVSLWAEKIHSDASLNSKFLVNGVGRGLARYECFYAGMSFEAFARVIAKIPDALADPHFASQHTFICNQQGQVLVDFIGRFETLEDDFMYIGRRIGTERFRLPHLVRSNHRKYRDYYTDKTKRLVEQRYAKDIELFEYSFDL